MKRVENRLTVERQRLCVVIPVHNEADNLVVLIEDLQNVASQLKRWDVEILLVDDGSSDTSVQRICEIRARGAPVGYIRLSRNFGHQSALCAGLERASGDAIITMDSDLQHPPCEIVNMLEAHEAGADVVQMVRARSVGSGRGLCSRWFYRIFNWLSDTPIVPNAADFRLISRRVLEVLQRIPEREKFLRGLIPSLGFRQSTLEYDQPNRLYGTPKYSFRMSFRLARKVFFDFSTVPLRLVFWLGLTISVLSFGFGAGHFLWKLFHWDTVVPGFTDLITAIFFLNGCILASTGVVGRYLLTILEQIRGRPSFVIAEHMPGLALSTLDRATTPEGAISLVAEV